jgi:hypothetical protein
MNKGGVVNHRYVGNILEQYLDMESQGDLFSLLMDDVILVGWPARMWMG